MSFVFKNTNLHVSWVRQSTCLPSFGQKSQSFNVAMLYWSAMLIRSGTAVTSFQTGEKWKGKKCLRFSPNFRRLSGLPLCPARTTWNFRLPPLNKTSSAIQCKGLNKVMKWKLFKGFETQYLRKQPSNIFLSKGQRAPNFLFQLADVAPFGLNMGLAWILAMGSFGWVGTTSTFQMVLSKMHHQEHYSKLSVFAMNWREC